MSTMTLNPWDEANSPKEPTRVVFGSLTIDTSYIAFVDDPATGRKTKIPYNQGDKDPATGKELSPVVNVKIEVVPFDPSAKWPVYREVLASARGEWGTIILPSLRDCGVTDVSKIATGHFAKIELVPTGRSYTNAAGQTREASTVKFLQIFESEPVALGAYYADTGNDPAAANRPTTTDANTYHSTLGGGMPVAQPVAQQASAQPGAVNQGERATAERFLKIYVANACKSAGGDLDKARATLGASIASQALLSRYFTVDDPTVVDMLVVGLAA